MTEEIDWKEIARRKAPEGAPEWLIDFLAQDEDFRGFADIMVIEVKADDEIELYCRSGSGSLISLHSKYVVKRGSIVIVDRDQQTWSAGAAWSRTEKVIARLKPGSIVYQIVDEYRSPEHTYYLRVYYRP